MSLAIIRMVIVLLVVCCAVGARGQTPGATQSVTTVSITDPAGSPGEPYRTSRNLVSLSFSSDAAGGSFVAASEGGDVPFSTYLVHGGSGRVGVGLNREGLHTVRVRLAALDSGAGSTGVAAVSAPVSIVYDRTPPQVQLTGVRLNEELGFIPWEPRRRQYTNRDRIELRGRVTDQWSPAEMIRIRVRGGAAPVEAIPDTSGRFELTVPFAGMDDGDYTLSVTAVEIMSDGTEGEADESLRLRLSRISPSR